MKRMAALSLVLLLSIESFAAVVSDNDGSAFITKAEFDSLKNNFQSQIDQYNTSIDSKIDGAIASYLSGIKLNSEQNLQNASSVLEYPLKVFMSNKKQFDISRWTDFQYASSALYPGYNFNVYTMRGTELTPYTETFGSSIPFDIAYLVKKNKSGTWLVSGAEKVSDIQISISGPIAKNPDAAEDALRFTFVVGPSTWGTNEYERDSFDIPLNSNYGTNWSVGSGLKSLPFVIGAYMDWGADTKIDKTTGSSYPYSKLVKQGIHGYSQATLNWGKQYSDYVVKESIKVDHIYNLNADVNEDFVLTEPNGKLFLTNNYFYRTILRQSKFDTPCYKRSNDKNHTSCMKGVSRVLSGGFTVEPVGYGNTSRDKEYKSLWKTSDINYDVILPISKTSVECKLTHGVLLTEFPKKEMENAKITFDIDLSNYDSTVEANLPKIVFSKNEIGDASNDSVQNDCLTIYTNKSFSDGTKTKTIRPGTNTIYLKEPESLSKLYYKIYFANNYTGYVNITEPEVTVLAIQ